MQKIEFDIYKFKSVTSTNDVAIKMIKNKEKEAGFIYANSQSNGRGTRGKKWLSNKGNLFGSIFFPLNENYPPFNEFSIINSVIISSVIKNFCKKKITSLKFPNDILVSGKKICGILQEIINLNGKFFLVIGIGINVISNPIIKNKYKATNIFFETKKKVPIKKILNKIITNYEEFFFNLSSYNYNEFKKKAKLMGTN